MSGQELLKNIEFAKTLNLAGLVEYQPGQVVSRALAQNPTLSVTLFAFDQGEGISSHTVSADALVVVLDGQAEITIGEKTLSAGAGEVVAMPSGVPHALSARERFKMLLVVVRPLKGISL